MTKLKSCILHRRRCRITIYFVIFILYDAFNIQYDLKLKIENTYFKPEIYIKDYFTIWYNLGEATSFYIMIYILWFKTN